MNGPALTTFNTPFSTELRVIDRDGAPWFIAKDVCEALGLSDTSMALASVPAHDKHQQSLGLPGRAPWLVNESGFYKLVLKSRKPEARKFQDWVTGVVLPAIRKDGGYILGEEKVATGELSEDELVLKVMTTLKAKVDRLAAEKAAALQRAETSESRAQVLAVRATGL